ncbi:MAG: hypothetical protein MJ209_06960, partial [archaeon]|nr:hypothetical protein [archaeon]
MKIKKLYVVLLLLILLFSVTAINVVSATDAVTDISSDNSDIAIFTDENDLKENSNYLSINNNQNNNVNFNLETNTIQKVNLTADNVTMYYQNGSCVVARLTDSNGTPIANQNIHFLINGVTYTHQTDSKGYAYQGIGLSPNIYKIMISYDGSSLYEKASTVMTLTVQSTIIGSDIELYYNNGTYYRAKYVDGKGQPLIGAPISMNINGVFYNTVTDSKGYGSLYIGLYPNVYIITDYHPNGQLYSNKVTVKPYIIAKDVTVGYREGGYYQMTVLDNKGNIIPYAKVLLNIHGVYYTVDANSEGVAGLQINLFPNTYIMTMIHPDGLMVSRTITVLDNLDTYEVVENNRNFTESITEDLTFTLYNSLNHVLLDRPVEIQINQKSHVLTTNSKGQVNLPIDFKAGVYQGRIIFNREDCYKPSYKDFTVVVNALKPVNITMLNNNVLFNGENISSLFTEADGTPLANKNVSTTINNKENILQTNELGIATIDPGFSSGELLVIFKAIIPLYSDNELVETVYVYDTNVTTLEVINPLIKRGEYLEVLLKANSTPIPDKLVKITINGEPYVVSTNDWGIASLLIILYCNDYPATISFAGDDLFKQWKSTKRREACEPADTKLTLVGDHIIKEKKKGYYSVRLTDVDGNAIANQNITFTLNGTYINNKTDDDGTASIFINLPVGKYTVYYSFDGNKYYSSSNGFSDLIVKERSSVLTAGYYVQKQNVEQVDFKKLADSGVDILFLSSASIAQYGQERIQKFINDAHSYGIEVHLWTSVYNDGGYISPVNEDESINYEFIFDKSDLIVSWLDLCVNFDGVHLDHCRFAGGAYNHPNGIAAITECVDIITNTIKKFYPDLIVSMTLMPERQVSATHYGQDITELSKIVDVVVPMAYKGNYQSPNDWIGNVAKWYQEKSQGADVWIALTSYYSDDDSRLLTPDELLENAQSAVDGGSSGVIFFRYGYCNDIDFNDIDTHNITPSHDIPLKYEDILNAASELKVEIEEKGLLPAYVTVGEVKVTIPQFLYLMSKAIGQMDVSTKDINLISVDNCHADTGDEIYGYLNKNEFMDVANRVATYIETYGEAPNYASTNINNVKYSALIYTFSRILAYYNENAEIPARVYVDNYLDNSILTVNMKPSSIHTEGYKYIN